MLVVDTCVLIDIADDDPTFGRASAECLGAHLAQGLVCSPVSYVELGPVFDGSARFLDEFLQGVGVASTEIFGDQDRPPALAAWSRHISQKRAGTANRRPIADVLIGALAARHDGLVTRNGGDFLPLYPKLRIIDPMAL